MLGPTIAQILIVGIIATVISHLYLSGNEYTDITGGWVSLVWPQYSATMSQRAPVLTHATTYLQAEMPETGAATTWSGCFGPDNAVNLTGVTKIRVKLSAYLSAVDSGGIQQIFLFATQIDPPVNWGQSSVYAALALAHAHTLGTAETLTDVTYDLNVSLTGNYWVYVGLVWTKQTALSWVRVSEVDRIY